MNYLNVPMVTYPWQVLTCGGDHVAALMLNKATYWYLKMNMRPFYKYIEPPQGDHQNSYTVGDSWCEEMALSKRQVQRARRVIATKHERPLRGPITKKYDACGQLLPVNQIVHYWQSNGNKWKYTVNLSLLYEYQRLYLGEIIDLGTVDFSEFLFSEVQNGAPEVTKTSSPTLRNGAPEVTKTSSPISETTQKNTQENTQILPFDCDSLFDAIAEIHFHIPLGTPVSNSKKQEVSMVYDILKPKNITAEDVYGFPAYWKKTNLKYMPRKLTALETAYLEYKSKMGTSRESEDKVAQKERDAAENEARVEKILSLIGR